MGFVTQISNGTRHTMHLRVGRAPPLATVAPGGTNSIGVDLNMTYREYVFQVDAPGLQELVVTSDDLCDNEAITITEHAGKLNMLMEARPAEAAASDPQPSQASQKPQWIPAWMSSYIGAVRAYVLGPP